MIDFEIPKKMVAVAVLLMMLLAATASLGAETSRIRVERYDNKFSIQADHAPLLRVLSELSGQIKANLFLTDSIAASPVVVHCRNVTLVKALRSILRDFDFVASFSENSKGEDDISLVRIYPKGNRTGNLIKVVAMHSNVRSGAADRTPQNLGRNQARMNSEKTFSGILGSQPLAQAGLSGTTDRDVMIARRDLNQQLDQHLQSMANEEWGIQHSTAVAAPSNSNAVAIATTQLADVVSEKAQSETMLSNVNAGLDRLQFLQQNDVDSFAVTLVDATSSPQK